MVMVIKHVSGKGGGVRGPADRIFDADTLRWAVGDEIRWCACDECWAELPFWRYVAVIRDRWRRAHPNGSRAELANHIWALLSAGRARLALWSVTKPSARAGLALRSAGERDGWNLGELYEIVMRGIAHRDGG